MTKLVAFIFTLFWLYFTSGKSLILDSIGDISGEKFASTRTGVDKMSEISAWHHVILIKSHKFYQISGTLGDVVLLYFWHVVNSMCACSVQLRINVKAHNTKSTTAGVLDLGLRPTSLGWRPLDSLRLTAVGLRPLTARSASRSPSVSQPLTWKVV